MLRSFPSSVVIPVSVVDVSEGRQAHIDSQERIHDHDLESTTHRASDNLVSLRPVIPNDVSNRWFKPDRLVQELEDVDHAAQLLRNELDDVKRSRDIVGITSPHRIIRALPRIVVSVLRAWGAMQVEYNVQAALFRPVQGLQQVGPGSGYVRANIRGVVRV